MDCEFTIDDLFALRDSLNYGIQRVRDYPHQEYAQKLDSLRPIEAVREKVLLKIAAIRKANSAH
jgi:hypothetical protein